MSALVADFNASQACVEVAVEELADLGERISRAMAAGDLAAASADGLTYAALRWGAPGHALSLDGRLRFPRGGAAELATVAKLRHDVEQFAYLHRQGVLGDEAEEVSVAYRAVIARLVAAGARGKTPLTASEVRRIGPVYSRLLHLRNTPRVPRALSESWIGAQVERRYLAEPLGALVIDDFLTPQALEGLRRFCLESTIWSISRYAHGRLGSFFRDGFNCPLLIQIAEELREAMPRLIGPHPLRQLWGFKYASAHPGNSAHADFAAVNVNFWITSEEANLDPGSGGLVVYDAEAPLDWAFTTYNKDSSAIRRFLQERRAGATRIPYRANRGVIFNSDLFHSTDVVEFKPGYENRRVNITLLYGDRRQAAHRAGAPRS